MFIVNIIYKPKAKENIWKKRHKAHLFYFYLEVQ